MARVLIRLNRFFHLGKNRKRSDRFCCDILRFIAIYCDFFTAKRLKRTVKIYSLHGFPFRYSRKFKIDRVQSYRMTHH